MKGLTPRQREIFDFIQNYIASHNYSPSYREIMAHFGFNSLGSVYKHLYVLKRKGIISSEKNCSRSIIVTKGINFEQESLLVELPFLGCFSENMPIQTFPQTKQILVPRSLVLRPEKSYVIKAQGNDMISDNVVDGDLIIIEATQEANPGDIVLVLLRQSETTLKRYYHQGAYVRLEYHVPAYSPIIVRPDEVTVQGILRGLIRHYNS